MLCQLLIVLAYPSDLLNFHEPTTDVLSFVPTRRQKSSPKVAIVKVESHLIADTSLITGEQISGGVFGDDSTTI